MHTAPALGQRPTNQRLLWLDASRVFAALGVVLIHSTTDGSGQPFPGAGPEGRLGPALLRAVAELSGSEIFLVFSMFLLAARIDRRPTGYGALLREQGRRLLLPFVAWTVFYAFFRLVKAQTFGYLDAIVAQLHELPSWLGYLILGNAQYHLHFMPTLYGLILMSPLMVGAARFPLLGLSLVGFLYTMDTIQGWLWANIADPVTRYWIDQLVKDVCFSGYGVAGFAIYGLWKQRLSEADSRVLLRGVLLTTAIAFLATLAYIGDIVTTGRWVARPGASFYGHYFMPVLVFLCFFAAQYRAWSERFSWLARFTLGFYLVHPIALDTYDIAMFRLGMQLAPLWSVVLKFVLAVPGTFLLVYGLSRAPLLAWLIGLESRRGREGWAR